jgi:hypothetical protein
VQRGDEAVVGVDADAGRDDDVLAGDVDVEMLVDVQCRSFGPERRQAERC